MKGSLPLGRIFGIRIYLHWSCPLVILLMAWWAARGGDDGAASIRAALYFAGMMTSVFCCILLHELGHCVTTIAFGYRVADVTLLGIGGVARMVDLPTRPIQEFTIAIAGPAVNFAIAAGLLLVEILWLAARGMTALSGLTGTGGGSGFLLMLALMNLNIGLFNLLPAYPMDGGRILRAFFGFFMPFVTATRMATWIGQVLGVLMIALGIAYFSISPLLALLGAFVFIMAGAERRSVMVRSRFDGIPTRAAMVPVFETVVLGEPIEAVLARSRATFQQDFPVRDDQGRIIGLLTYGQLREAVRTHPGSTPVHAVLPPAPTILAPDLPLFDAFTLFQRGGGSAGLVVEEGRVIGILTLERILRAF